MRINFFQKSPDLEKEGKDLISAHIENAAGSPPQNTGDANAKMTEAQTAIKYANVIAKLANEGANGSLLVLLGFLLIALWCVVCFAVFGAGNTWDNYISQHASEPEKIGLLIVGILLTVLGCWIDISKSRMKQKAYEIGANVALAQMSTTQGIMEGTQNPHSGPN
ncbi:MAG: hypothetical protein ABJO09_00135 [Hyphomicrobiales bacterium]|uniref:hypothetical protein n=1 Tax=Roseobacteraceae TaxID=2854170 RepID=UPI00328BC7E9